ncbi:MAG: hypothetical protein O7G84_15135 [Gammaproteobacteria bacterium]|nr:hypothetical protein [Gammaproteobacteria bacterium]
MFRLVIGVLFGLLVLPVIPAFAVDPTPGTYTSVSGDVLKGRGSNARPAVDVGVDNVFHAQSWDGAALGIQWDFTCGISTSQITDNNLDGAGNGEIIFTTEYSGGTFFLSKDGLWGDTVNDLTGTINDLTRVTTLVFVLGVPIAAVENVSTSGLFDDSDCILAFEINNNVGLGDTDSGTPLPLDYPPFLDTSCGDLPFDSPGSWGDISDIIMLIQCPVPAHETTWGQVKALFE